MRLERGARAHVSSVRLEQGARAHVSQRRGGASTAAGRVRRLRDMFGTRVRAVGSVGQGPTWCKRRCCEGSTVRARRARARRLLVCVDVRCLGFRVALGVERPIVDFRCKRWQWLPWTPVIVFWRMTRSRATGAVARAMVWCRQSAMIRSTWRRSARLHDVLSRWVRVPLVFRARHAIVRGTAGVTALGRLDADTHG